MIRTNRNALDNPAIDAMYEHPDYEQISAETAEEVMQQGLVYWLSDLRRRRKFTQKKIAEELHISQPAVCQMLKKPTSVGTLWRLATAMGGSLDITITIDGETRSLLFGYSTVNLHEKRMQELSQE